MDFRTAYGKRKRVSIGFPKKGRTKQAFAKDCEINNIVRKYQRSGAIDHFSRHGPRYGEFSGSTFHQAMNIVCEASSMFEDLPSNVRARFENDPAKFLDFVQDPANVAEMADLGLVESQPVPVEIPREEASQEASGASVEAGSQEPGEAA